MERIKQALEKARQEREIRQDNNTPGQATSAPVVEPHGQDLTQTVSLDEAVLREHRIVTSLPPGAFTDAYNLLRTRILQTFKEHNWNTLAITSPGASAGKTLTATQPGHQHRTGSRLHRPACGCQPAPALDARTAGHCSPQGAE